MKTLGIALVVLGIVALIFGGISYTRQRTVLDVGAIHATATEHKTIPLPPIMGGIALVGGVLLLLGSRRRTA
jgi:uncharacterized membrane protein